MATERTFFGTPNFKRVVQGLLELHHLIREGKDDSPKAKAIRDNMDKPLDELSKVESERAQWLSEDLHSVTEAKAGQPRDSLLHPQISSVITGRQNQEWDLSLQILRELKDLLPAALLSYLRGSIWLEAGYPNLAAIFFEHAATHDPDNADYMALYMHALADSDPVAAREFVRQVLNDSDRLALAQA